MYVGAMWLRGKRKSGRRNRSRVHVFRLLPLEADALRWSGIDAKVYRAWLLQHPEPSNYLSTRSYPLKRTRNPLLFKTETEDESV